MDRVLTICKDELTGLLEEDHRLGQVKIELVHPGEKVRIINVLDVIEPRIKADGSGGMFPGIIGRVEIVGQGRTLALKGVGIVNTGFMDNAWEAVIDMTGPGARLSPYSSLNNVVIVPSRLPHVDQIDFVEGMVTAGLKTAEYLANVARGLAPDEVEVYEMEALTEKTFVASRLPRVVYLYQIYSNRDMRDTLYYGEKPRHIIPTLIHPNEVFDGAIVNGHYDMPSGMKNETIIIQNHPIIKELYKRHGKELWFLGVVITNEHAGIDEKEKSAVLAAKMIKHVLGADAAIISQTGGGHPNIDLMLNCRMCEQQGIKTAIVVNEQSSADGSQFSLTMIVSEANAIISTGNINEEVELPEVEQVVGGDHFRRLKAPPIGALCIPYNMIPGSTSQIGGGRITAVYS
jgi:glycine reductase